MRRLAAVLITAVLTGSGLMSPAASYAAPSDGNVVTPGNFTGYGFDQCVGPSQSTMNAWLKSSPFLAVGIYVSGDSRGCRTQPHLTQKWVATQLRKGWRLLPITLGPQASCHPGFPRYDDDEVINPQPGKAKRYKPARVQGRQEAVKAVEAAQALGIVAGSTLWYDLEGFTLSNTHCRESSLAFLSSWTTRLHELDYVSGVYSSAGSGIKMLDDARVERPAQVVLPDQIWIARWDGKADTSTSYIRDDGWLPGGRMKQYRGGHNETWGGVTINIDSNWLDLGLGSVAAPVAHCGTTNVDFPTYKVLSKGTTETALVTTLQCLLKEQGLYAGKLNGSYTDQTIVAANAWQTQRGLTPTTVWGRVHWMSLLSVGASPVLKFGSASDDVRRLQRALNAASATLRLPVSGTYTQATAAAVSAYQENLEQTANGIVIGSTWKALRAGKR